ncbi:MAG TPA: SDR family oxidoreductase [Thermoanaerobaculia bacterium]|nr:SDR family oxidoreductase [Thermoanaerobaculia bacterium]
MDLGISGRTAAVAAASAGLGFASARALVEEGVRVAVCSRDRERIEAAARALGGQAVPIVADLSDEAGARGFLQRARELLGPIDILVANAGGPPPGQPSTTPLDAYRAALDLNLLSTIALCQEAVGSMRERRWGRIVAITSSGARQPIPFLAASSVARAGVTSFLKTLATEVAADGVTVNSIQPGLHATDRVKELGSGEDLAQRIPARAIGAPGDFGRLVALLASQPARFVTGTSLLVDGGGYPGLI